jgi:hypothetical protein
MINSNMRRVEHVARNGNMSNVYKVWPENLKGRNQLGDAGLSGDNIKMYLKNIGCEGVEWIQLA